MTNATSEAPEHKVSEDERAQAQRELELRKQAAERLGEVGGVSVTPEEAERYRVFVCDPKHNNERHLVNPTPQEAEKYGVAAVTPVVAPPHPGMSTGVQPLSRRDNAIWAEFKGGVLVTDQEPVIKWCEAHPSVCRDATDEMTKPWVTLKEMQVRRSNRESLMDTSQMNADEAFPPNMVGNLKAQAAKQGSYGSDLVDQAITTRDKQTKTTEAREADTERLRA